MKPKKGLKFECYYGKGNRNNFTATIRAVVDKSVIVVLATYNAEGGRKRTISAYELISEEDFFYNFKNKIYKVIS